MNWNEFMFGKRDKKDQYYEEEKYEDKYEDEECEE